MNSGIVLRWTDLRRRKVGQRCVQAESTCRERERAEVGWRCCLWRGRRLLRRCRGRWLSWRRPRGAERLQLGEEPCVELLLLRLPHSHPGRYVAVRCLLLLLLLLHGRLLLDRLLLLLLLLLRLIWLAILVRLLHRLVVLLLLCDCTQAGRCAVPAIEVDLPAASSLGRLAVSGAAQLWAATCAALRIALSLAALAALATGARHGKERGEWRGRYD